MREVVFTSEDGGVGVITKRKCGEGTFVRKGRVIIEYRLEGADPQSRPLKLCAPSPGVVQYKPATAEQDKLINGTPLCTLIKCTHPTAIRGSCATCLEAVEITTMVPTMLCSNPDFLVSDQMARDEGEREKLKRLKSGKLFLLVDLDQTVIHTTNKPPSFDTKLYSDITHFELNRLSYWTKLRPYTRSFFEDLLPLYEMYIITFGDRKYADEIAKIVDPTRRIFSNRILSRDESLSQQHKTKNLAALFPAGEEMVAIIDDRPDVWEFSDALIQLNPYKYFPDVDDINAPPGARRPVQAASRSVEMGDGSPDETDEALVHVLKVLKKVHESFYNGNIRDLKVIISCLREQFLKGCVLVLSGLIPVGSDPKRSEAYRIATKFGARVEEKVDEQTTHVVAARWGTTKVEDADRLGIHVVNPHWLIACMELWEKAPEQSFILTKNSVYANGTSLVSALSREVLMTSERPQRRLESSGKAGTSGMSNPIGGSTDGAKIDERRVKRKLCPEALDRGYTGENDDPFGEMSNRKRSKRFSRAAEEEELEKRDAEGAHYGDNDDDNEDIDDDDDDMDDMAAELEHQLEH